MVAVLEGKMWQLNPDPNTLDHDCKIRLFNNKPLDDLEWDPLDVWWLTPGRISGDLLKSFWRRLWALDMPEKIKVWLWLLSHKAVLVGEKLGSRGGEHGCKLCGHALESIFHCF